MEDTFVSKLRDFKSSESVPPEPRKKPGLAFH